MDQSKTKTPPVASVMPRTLEEHGYMRTDGYYWLRDRDDRKVIEYLKAENDYTDEFMAHTKDLQIDLFDEIKGRIKQTDESVPYRLDDYYYYYYYYCKSGMFEQETFVLRSARPGMKLRPDCSLHANEYKHAHVATGKRFHGVIVGGLLE